MLYFSLLSKLFYCKQKLCNDTCIRHKYKLVKSSLIDIQTNIDNIYMLEYERKYNKNGGSRIIQMVFMVKMTEPYCLFIISHQDVINTQS